MDGRRRWRGEQVAVSAETLHTRRLGIWRRSSTAIAASVAACTARRSRRSRFSRSVLLLGYRRAVSRLALQRLLATSDTSVVVVRRRSTTQGPESTSRAWWCPAWRKSSNRRRGSMSILNPRHRGSRLVTTCLASRLGHHRERCGSSQGRAISRSPTNSSGLPSNKALNRTWNSAVKMAAVPFWHRPSLARPTPAALFHAG